MSSEADDLRKELAALGDRVTRLEAKLSEVLLEQRSSHPSIKSAAAPPISPAQTGAPAARTPAHSDGSSLESRIGSQLFNRIGILAVLIGMAWFLKFAIDNHWIGPLSRVVIGLLAGAALILWSERFRARGYSAFSYSLKAIGTGTLYLSLWAAYTLFHLIPGEIAFGAMIAVTAWNALMCWTQNSEVLAFYAAIGGFITPLLLSIGENHELTLFSYLFLLDLAAVALIALRPWSRLLLAAFAGTLFYSIGWYWRYYAPDEFAPTLFFFLAFFLLFAIAPQLLRSLRLATAAAARSVEDNLVLILLPLLNAAVAFFEVYALMSAPAYLAWRPWIALPFAAFYLLMLRLSHLQRQQSAPVALPAVYLGISVVFITIAIPLEANGRWITIGWFLEFAVLLYLARQWADRSLRIIALCVLAIALIAILAPASIFNPPASAAVLVNTRFGTYLISVAATVFAARTALAASKSHSAVEGTPTWRTLAAVCGLAVSFLAMTAVCLEIHAYWTSLPASVGSALRGTQIDEQFSYSAWSMVFGAALLAAGFWRKSAFLRWQALVLLALSIAKVFLIDMRQLTQGYRILSFLGLGALLLAVSFAYQRDWLSLRRQITR
jgi:uncharacterized membrane protein